MRLYPPYTDLPALAHAQGCVRLPGSKSISNRTLLLAALSQGTTRVHDLLASEDVEHMLAALRTLGVRIGKGASGEEVVVHGRGGVFPVKEADLFLGNAGTAFRPLTAVLALSGGHYKLSGVPRMHERPIGDLVEALRQTGADVRYLRNEGYPPLEIFPATVRLGAPVRVRGGVSSQFLTALLMALPLTGEDARIEVAGDLISKPYIELTLKMLARFGLAVTREEWRAFRIAGGQRYQATADLYVEGDASSASYFLAAGAIGGGPVRVQGVGRDSIQGDVLFAPALEQLGARIEYGDNWIEASGTRPLKAFDLDLNHIPDAAMTLAIAALFTDGPCRLRNIASWRIKETDRLAAMATELCKVGATVEEGSDYLVVVPPSASRLTPHARISTYDDHRMAMCFSLVALGEVPIRIDEPKCVAKTFPNYFERFAAITGRAPVIAIDGPSASGKGTVAERVATALGYRFLDSGALYRLVALAAIESKTSLADEKALARLALDLNASFQGGEIFLAGARVTERIRQEDVSDASSRVSSLAGVRVALLDRQRAFRTLPGLVADGRDMGSVVFPDAVLKVFLTASAEERARRRYKQLMAKGISVNLRALLVDINARDARDAQRSVAPLQRCQDAQLLDTTALDIEQAVNQVLAWAESIQAVETTDSDS
ncbi:MAG: bifunctional 3-phosphoshikimate 1-carboxyvinyltransferase/cytidylate kinase [Betaproteobacteria bacterium]|nr:bifunctional 3-phosphoshikimate 1-carboxyvinyltransferase/cytidylate kinase [Betaproteobacteria bacterium]